VEVRADGHAPELKPAGRRVGWLHPERPVTGERSVRPVQADVIGLPARGVATRRHHPVAEPPRAHQNHIHDRPCFHQTHPHVRLRHGRRRPVDGGRSRRFSDRIQGQAHLPEYRGDGRRVQPFEIASARGDDDTGQVDGPRAHEHAVARRHGVVGRPVTAPGKQRDCPARLSVPEQEVDERFGPRRVRGQAMQPSGQGPPEFFFLPPFQDNDRAAVLVDGERRHSFDRGQLPPPASQGGLGQVVHIRLDEGAVPRDGLEVQMVRRRRTAAGSVVQQAEAAGQPPRQREHGRQTGVQRLGTVVAMDHHRVGIENRKRVEEEGEIPVHRQAAFRLRHLGRAEEAGAPADGHRIHGRGHTGLAGGIIFQAHPERPERHLPVAAGKPGVPSLPQLRPGGFLLDDQAVQPRHEVIFVSRLRRSEPLGRSQAFVPIHSFPSATGGGAV